MLTIRSYSAQDARGVIDLVLPIQQIEFGVPVKAADQPDLLDIPAHYFKNNGHFWVALWNNEIVGTMGLLDYGNGGFALRKMFVAKTYRGAQFSIAARLWEEGLEWARRHQGREIVLGTVHQLKAAHRFYEKQGFQPVDPSRLPAAFPRMEVDTLFYRYDLTGSPALPVLTNWSGNFQFGTSAVERPASVAAVQNIVRTATKLKVIGTRHSFNRIADSDQLLVSLERMDQVVELDTVQHKVTVEAGISYGALAPFLEANGYALHNLASLPHISIAGACMTATHGSGIELGNLATAVSGMEMVDGRGDILQLSRANHPAVFPGAVVSLGALGIVTKLTLDLVPHFTMRQFVYRNLPIDQLQTHVREIFSSAYSVSLFTNWRNGLINTVWLKMRADDPRADQLPQVFYNATIATEPLHPLEGESPINCTDQLGTPGPWYERLPHFKMGFKPSAGEELQSEYFIPVEHAYAAIKAMEALQEEISPYLYVSEIRVVRADELWLSPAFQQNVVAIHTTWKRDPEKVQELLPKIEAALSPFRPRPHWGKLFTLAPAILQERTPNLDKFLAVAEQFDPAAKFRNDFLLHYLWKS
jgi:xylitol oxidase